MTRNIYLDGFLQFYSQAEAGNGLTRRLETDLAKRTYVSTRLDQALTPALLRGHIRLAILTGNAGDGKTAVIALIRSTHFQPYAQVGVWSFEERVERARGDPTQAPELQQGPRHSRGHGEPGRGFDDGGAHRA